MKKNRLLPLICSIALAIFVSWLIGTCIRSRPTYPIYELSKGFDVTINENSFSNVDITEFYKLFNNEKLKKDDIITMSFTLPETEDFPFPCLLFRSRYTTLECFLDGKEIYSFATDMYEKKQFIGKMYHFISLPLNYKNARITMKMVAGEADAFNTLAPVRLGSQPDVESGFIHEHMAIIATGMFLFVFGVVFLCITMFFVAATPDILPLLLGSLFCLNLGPWIMSYYNVLAPFFHTRYETQIEYFTLYLIIPYCYLLMYFIQKIEKKRFFLTLAFISTAITLTQFVLHFIFNIHLRVTLPMYHIDALVSFGVLIYYLIRNIRFKELSPSGILQMAGLTVFAFSEIIHLVLYNLDGFHIPYSSFLAIMVIDSGCLFFVMCQLANYLLYVTESYAQKKEYASLTHLAYADGLTNMSNRAKADKILEDFNKLSSDYCIISIDLNGLKYVNDEFGHPSGDKYIKDFSKVLTTTFEESGICARIGGDEFLVLIEDGSDKDIDALIGRMNSALNVMNALYSEYQRSVATGYAFRHECPEGSPSHEVYLLADQRMYEEKRKMHEELGIKNRL